MESLKNIATVLIVLSMVEVASAQHLETTDRAKGPEVVEAVVDMVRRSCVLPQDNLLLRRLAYVESHDGTDEKTFRPNFYGGIWQVTQEMYDRTKRSPYLQNFRNGIREHLSIDWMSTSWQDLTKPLYSCLAAALFVEDVLRDRPHPVGVASQADFWAREFLNGNAQTYTTLANIMDKGCHGQAKLDIVFVVDTSSSISSQDFEHAKQFIINVSSAFQLGNDHTRVAVITYSTGARVSLTWDQAISQAQLDSYVRGLTYETGGTDTDQALNAARTLFVEHPRDSVKVVVVVTDGRSHDRIDTNQAASLLAHTAGGVTLLSVGVGDLIDKDELNSIVTNPPCTHSFQVDNYGNIDAMVEEIQRLSCRAPLSLSINQTVQCEMSKCPPYVVNAPDGTNVMVKVNTTCRTPFNTYASSSNPYPVLQSYEAYVTVNATGDSIFYLPQSFQRFASQSLSSHLFYFNVNQGWNSSCLVTLTALMNVVQVVCLDNGRQRVCSPEDIVAYQRATGLHLCP